MLYQITNIYNCKLRMCYFKWKRQTQWNHGSNGKQSQQLPKPLLHGTMINDYYELEWEVGAGRRQESKLWPKNTVQESQQPWSGRTWWTFHILPFVHVNANSGMWYPVHILCYYSTIPSSTFCYASYLLTVCLLWSQESTCCNPLSWCKPIWAVNGWVPEKDSPSKMS